MKEIRFHPEAEQELQKRVAEFPERYAKGSRGERRFVFRRYPFTLMYRVKGDHVFITAVAHQSRRLGYWRHRE